MVKRLLMVLFVLSSTLAHADSTVRVLAASNIEPALSRIIARFNTGSGIVIQVKYGGATTLAEEVARGHGDYQIYLSANEDYPKRLAAQGFCLGQPQIYAYGHIVFWSTSKQFTPSRWLDWLRQSHGKVAVPDPRFTTYGQAILYLLNHYQLAEQLKSRLLKARDTRSTADLVINGSAEAGFVAKSQVLSPRYRGQGQWVELPVGSYPPIRQAAILLNPAKDHSEASLFFAYLFSPEARRIWQESGYDVPAP